MIADQMGVCEKRRVITQPVVRPIYLGDIFFHTSGEKYFIISRSPWVLNLSRLEIWLQGRVIHR